MREDIRSRLNRLRRELATLRESSRGVVVAGSSAIFAGGGVVVGAGIGHYDSPHGDSTPGHLDIIHIDSGHMDFFHGDGYSDSAHDDLFHDDRGHDDTGHDDTGHDDGGHDDGGHDDGGHDDSGDRSWFDRIIDEIEQVLIIFEREILQSVDERLNVTAQAVSRAVQRITELESQVQELQTRGTLGKPQGE